jgi:hypothetical protein
MRFIPKIWLVLLTVALVHGAAFAASFSASLDRDAIALGEEATLSLAFEGGQPSDVRMPQVPGLQINQVGNTTQVSSDFSGHSTSVTTYSLSVTASQIGEYVIPSITAEINGQKFSSQPLKLTVGKTLAPAVADVIAGKEPAFLKLLVPKSKVYVGEPMVAQLELYLRDDVQDLRGFQPNSLPTDGFSAGKMLIQQGMRRRAQVGSRTYTVFPLTLPLIAVRAGNLTLGPVAATVSIVVAAQNERGDPFFGRFFNQGEQKQVAVATESVNVDALPLPEQNKPADFTGAVGEFTMSATAGPTTVTVGDPITVRVQISGRGAFDTLSLPAQNAWRDFKTYPPTTKLETSDQFGFQGTKTYEQIVSPENADVHELPPLTFSFFNPDDGRYHTLTQAAVPLVVKPAGATPVPTLAVSRNIAPENQAPVDIGPIKAKLGSLSRGRTPLLTRPAFLATQTLPVLAFLAALIWRRRTDQLANNPRLRRRRAVAQLVASGLHDLTKYAAANQPDEFFATLFRLLQEQLGERLDCPASAITENVVEEQALLRGAPPATREALREQFQLCNQARYAPVRGTSELNSVAAQFEKLIHELQELKE